MNSGAFIVCERLNQKNSKPVSQVLSLRSKVLSFISNCSCLQPLSAYPSQLLSPKTRRAALPVPGLRYTWPFNSTGTQLIQSPAPLVVSCTTFSPLPLARRFFSSALLYPHKYLSFGRSMPYVAQTFLTARAAR